MSAIIQVVPLPHSLDGKYQGADCSDAMSWTAFCMRRVFGVPHHFDQLQTGTMARNIVTKTSKNRLDKIYAASHACYDYVVRKMCPHESSKDSTYMYCRSANVKPEAAPSYTRNLHLHRGNSIRCLSFTTWHVPQDLRVLQRYELS